MKKIILLFIGLALCSCSSDSESNPSDPSNPAPVPTEKILMVTETNIPITQGELKLYLNGASHYSTTNTMLNVEVGDNVRVESGSTAPISTQYYISVAIGSKIILNHHTSAYGEQMVWTHIVTTQDFD